LSRLVDAGHSVDVIYLDFAKAFDKVPHQRLLCKLQAHGITGKVKSWIESWLSGRQQRVVLNGIASAWAPVTSGVPQGSVLGPICFVIFINDIHEILDVVNGFIYKFADDTKYGRIVVEEEDREAMQKDIDKLMQWAETWQMDYNTKKCKIMHIGRSNPCFTYTMGGYAPGGVVLEAVDEEKDIGVKVHKSLKPSSQCLQAAAKANRVLGQIAKSFKYREKSVWIHLYTTYVRHHLEFAGQAWSPWLKHDIDILEKVQIRAVNMVIGLTGKSYEEKLCEVGLLSLYDRRVRGDAIQVWKVVHGHNIMDPSMFKHVDILQNRLTRNTAKHLNLVKPKARLEVRRNFFSVRSVDVWNSLPEDIQSAATLKDFKEKYDGFVHNIVWNSPNNYVT
jgi:hypothetical protein